MADGLSGISDVEPVVEFVGSGSRGPFPLTKDGAAMLYASSAEVHLFRVTDEGDIESMVEGVDYDLTSTLDAGTGLYSGSVTIRADKPALAAASGSTPAERLVAYREGALDQSFTMSFNAAFPSQSFTALQNKLIMRLQELRAMIKRAPLAPHGDDLVEVEDRLQRRGKVFGYDPETGEGGAVLLAEAGDGTALMMGTFAFDGDGSTVEFRVVNQHIPGEEAVLIWVGGSVQATDNYAVTIDGDDTLITFGSAPPSGTGNVVGRILGYRSAVAAEAEDNAAASATAAAASAAAAATSATNAATSETNANSDATDAAASEAAAATSESNAAASETAAAASEAAAAASATAAAASATSASTAETNAASSASAAASSATTATTQAGNAAASATAAAASETAAAASETAAAASETAAATSESNAAASEAAAATSESNAAASETAAAASATAAQNAADIVELAINGYAFEWDTGTADANPGEGCIRADNAALGSATFLYVDEDDALGAAVGAIIDTWDDSTSATRGYITLRKRSNPVNFVMFAISDAITDAGDYRKVPVTYIGHAGSFSDGDILGVILERTGNQGSAGAGTGDVLAANNGSEYSANALAFRGNIAAAPVSATYIVQTANSELSNDRALTDTSTIGWDFATASQAKASVLDGSISMAKLADIATDSLFGRDASGSGVPTAIGVGGGIEFTGSNALQLSAFTGDVTKSAGGTTLTIANLAVTTGKLAANAVTLAKLAQIATQRILGRNTASPGDVEEITAANVFSWINSTRGSLYYVGAAGAAGLAPGTSGYALISAGAGADPAYGQLGTTGIANNAVTLAKMAQIATDRLIGRDTAGTGDPEAISLTGGLEFTGTQSIQVGAFTGGDVTKSAGSVVLSIAAGAVTFAKLASAAIASAANFWANTASKLVDVAAVWAAATPVTITFNASQTLDFGAFINGKITLTGNMTLQTPSNLKPGQSGVIEMIQDATGSRTLTMTNATFISAGGTDLVLSTAANARDLLSYYITNDSKVFLAIAKAAA